MAESPPPFDPAAIRAVAFDAYGTLLQFHDDEFRVAVTEILERQGLEHPDHDEIHRTFAMAWWRSGPWGDRLDADGQPNRDDILDGPLPPWISAHEIWRRGWEAVIDRHHLAGGDPVAAADYLNEALTAADAYPDAQETLERLAAHGLTLGLFSDADDDFLQGALSRNRLRFSVIQSSESLRAYKPHRAVFTSLCNALGCEPREVLYVGDSPPRDVQGASHSGLRSVLLRRSDREYPARIPAPDVEVRSLSEVANLFDNHGGGAG